MTEVEWLTSTDPLAMLECVTDATPSANIHGCRMDYRISDRKLRLFGLNLYLAFLSQKGKYWDGAQDNFDWIDRMEPPRDGWNLHKLSPAEFARVSIHCYTLHNKGPKYKYIMLPVVAAANLLREVIGNPFRPVTLPKPICWRCAGTGVNPPPKRQTKAAMATPCTVCGGRCPYLTPTVLALAQAAYEERSERKCERCGGKYLKTEDYGKFGDDVGDWLQDCPDCHGTGTIDDGTLDPQRLAVLSDALEEAGCQDAEILMHLRGQEWCIGCSIDDPDSTHYEGGGGWCSLCDNTGPQLFTMPKRGPCYRGCYVIDLLLGKN